MQFYRELKRRKVILLVIGFPLALVIARSNNARPGTTTPGCNS